MLTSNALHRRARRHGVGDGEGVIALEVAHGAQQVIEVIRVIDDGCLPADGEVVPLLGKVLAEGLHHALRPLAALPRLMVAAVARGDALVHEQRVHLRVALLVREELHLTAHELRGVFTDGLGKLVGTRADILQLRGDRAVLLHARDLVEQIHVEGGTADALGVDGSLVLGATSAVVDVLQRGTHLAIKQLPLLDVLLDDRQ